MDGDRFTSFRESDGLSGNHVRTLYEDSDGALWVGTYDGGLTRMKSGRFTRYTTADGLFSNGVFKILEDAAGNFWMSSNRGIFRISRRQLDDFAEGRLRLVTSFPYGREDGLTNTECNGGKQPAGVRTRDGRLWFPTQGGVASGCSTWRSARECSAARPSCSQRRARGRPCRFASSWGSRSMGSAVVGEFTNPTGARARALRRVAEDAEFTRREFDRAFVLMQYFGYLRRNPDDPPDADFSGFDFWLSKLDSFGGDYQKAEMVKAFLESSEYRGHFGP